MPILGSIPRNPHKTNNAETVTYFSPVILQMSQGGAAYFAGKGVKNDSQQASIAGAVAGAAYIRAISASYGIP